MDADTLSQRTIVELLQGLVRVPSVNPTLAPDEPGGEAAIATFARDWLAARRVDARLEEAAPGRPNLVAEVGAGAGPALVFCAHLDTVSPKGMTIPPFEPRLEGRRLYGRGSYDMKGGVAAAMAATAALAPTALRGRVMLALVVDEEHASLGADDFVRRHRADACIVAEPTEERLILTHKGFAWIEIVTRGVAAHGSRPDLGVSAIGKMGSIIAALERFDQETLRARTNPVLGPASLHCSLISGGVGISTYAPECRLKVERRTLPGESAEGAAKEIRDCVGKTGAQGEIELLFHRAPLVCAPDAAVACALRDAHRALQGVEPTEGGVSFWTDAAIFQEAGMPAVNYGPAGEGAHAAVEWVDIDSVTRCARVLYEAARRFCG